MKKVLIGIAISVIGTAIYDLIMSRQIFSTVTYAITSVWNFITRILQFEMRVWWILVILSILLIVIVLIKNRKINQLYDDYTKDVIHEWTWRWQWNGGLFSLHELENLMAICPICETQLTIKLKVSQNDRTNLSTLGNERTFIERGFHRDDPYAAPGFMCVRCGYGKIARSLPDFHDVKVWILAEVEERKRKMYVK